MRIGEIQLLLFSGITLGFQISEVLSQQDSEVLVFFSFSFFGGSVGEYALNVSLLPFGRSLVCLLNQSQKLD